MGKNRIDTANPRTIARLIKEGRGFGEGENYVCWLKVQDVPSLGRSHRIQGWRTGNRVVHLMSYLELQQFYTLEWDPLVIDYHEQFPLDLDSTKTIANRIGVRHPASNSKRSSKVARTVIVRAPNVMTTDLLVFYKDDGKTYREAHSVKPAVKLDGKHGERVKEKLHLERIYWEEQGTKWRLVTDEPVSPDQGFAPESLIIINKVLAANVEAVHGYYHLDQFGSLSNQDVERVNDFLLPRVQEGQLGLADLANYCDERLQLPSGASLTIAKYLIARKIWPADFSKPFHPCRPLALIER
jgi:hypothetical protein